MRHVARIAVLAILVVVSAGLTIAMLGLRGVLAQTQDARRNVNIWVADDPALAVATLYDTLSYNYQERTYLPGMYGPKGATERSPLSVNIKGWATFPGLYSTTSDNSLAYNAGQPLEATRAYGRQSPIPKILWTPTTKMTQGVKTQGTATTDQQTDTPAIRIDALGGTKFQTSEGRMVTSKMTSMPVLTTKLATPATNFGVSLKSETKNGQFALTLVQLRALLMDIQEAQKQEEGKARARFPGSLNDQLAKFELLVRIQNGMATDFRIRASEPCSPVVVLTPCSPPPDDGSPQR